jgi:hypothetical protein
MTTFQPRLRALPSFDRLPPDHVTFWVSNDVSAPHLQIGEFAVVDTTDRKLQHGELFLMQGNTGRRERSIVQTKLDRSVEFENESEAWATHQLRGFRAAGEGSDGIPLFTGLCDHYPKEWLQEHLLGRIVGFSKGPLGNLLDPTAGYVDEDAANAAFDEREYVDVMIATGHDPRVMRERDGRWSYIESCICRCFDKFSKEEVLALKWKESAASTGLQRVIAECARRGLISE